MILDPQCAVIDEDMLRCAGATACAVLGIGSSAALLEQAREWFDPGAARHALANGERRIDTRSGDVTLHLYLRDLHAKQGNL